MKQLTILILLLLLVGCGTRKRQMQVETTKTGVRLFEQKDVTTNARIKSTQKETIYEPIDPTKEMVLPDGRKSTNAKITDRIKEVDSVGGTMDKGRVNLEFEEQGRKKAVDVQTKKSNPYLWIALVALGLGGLFIWLKFKK